MYIGKSIRPLIKFYPSLYYNLTKGYIPGYSDVFNTKLEEFKEKQFFNFKYEYSPNYNDKILTTVQFNYDLIKSNGYTSVSEIRDKSTNTYVYEFVQIYEQNNKFIVNNEFHINGINKNKINLIINNTADIDMILNSVSDVNFGLMTYSGIESTEKLMYKMITTPDK